MEVTFIGGLCLQSLSGSLARVIPSLLAGLELSHEVFYCCDTRSRNGT